MRASKHERRPILVSFSGIDGAGKTTQIEALRARLQESGMRVTLVTFWDDVARLTRLRESSGQALFKGDKGVGTPSSPINRRDKNVRSWPMTIVRFFLYLIDGVSLRRAAKKAAQSDAECVIFDRYAYDELANLDLRNPLSRFYVRLIMKIIPRPHVSFLLDADPLQARARKPEYPLDFLYTCRQAYLDLSDLVGGITIVPVMPIRNVEACVLDFTLEGLFGCTGNDLVARSRLDGQKARPAA